MNGSAQPGSEGVATKLLKFPGNQKLTPPSSASADCKQRAAEATRTSRSRSFMGVSHHFTGCASGGFQGSLVTCQRMTTPHRPVRVQIYYMYPTSGALAFEQGP